MIGLVRFQRPLQHKAQNGEAAAVAFEGLQGLSALQDCQHSVRGFGETAKRCDDFLPEAAGHVMKR